MKEYYVEIKGTNGENENKYTISEVMFRDNYSDESEVVTVEKVVEQCVGMWAYDCAFEKCNSEKVLDYDNHNETAYLVEDAKEILDKYFEEYKQEAKYRIYELVASNFEVTDNIEIIRDKL